MALVSPAAYVGAAAVNSATSGGTSSGGSASSSTSYSKTYGTEASQRAIAAANSANTAANAAWEKAATYNAEEARKQREWAERMANTTYQRTVKDMIAAGINPILAANMGLSADSVNSGAAASMGNPMSYMSRTYADSESASQSTGNSWNESVSGIALLADALKEMVTNMTSSHNINIMLNGAKELLGGTGDTVVTTDENGNKHVESKPETTWDWIKDILMPPSIKNLQKYNAIWKDYNGS